MNSSEFTYLWDIEIISDERTDILVSDHALQIFQWISYTIVCEIIDLFGTVSNIVNVICFVKLGFKDPVNVSLLGNVYK